MRVGIWLDLRNPPQWQTPWRDHLAWTLDLIVEAERLGAQTVWLSEHHLFEDGYLQQPLTFAAAVAARTSRIRIGTSIVVAPIRPAIQIAEDAALIDVLSGGRLDLGLGAGVRLKEFELYGADFRRRYRVFEQQVNEMRRLWDGVLVPAPVQSPLPLWGGFLGPRGARMAGRLDMGLVAVAMDAVGEVGVPTATYAAYAAGVEDVGLVPAAERVAMGINTLVVADDPEEAKARIGPHFLYQVNTYGSYVMEGTGFTAPTRTDWDHGLAVLTPEGAAAHIKKCCTDIPVGEAYCWISLGGMPRDLAERHVELLCTDVAELLREEGE